MACCYSLLGAAFSGDHVCKYIPIKISMNATGAAMTLYALSMTIHAVKASIEAYVSDFLRIACIP